VINLSAPQLTREIKAAFPDVEVVELRRAEPIPDDLGGDVLLARQHSAGQVAALAHRVEWIHAFGTGIDWIPAEAFEAKHLTCARGGSAVAISEFVLAAMLAFEKQLPEVWARPPDQTWGWQPELGTLWGRRLGLIGFGGIGREVAVRARPFGMTVQAARRRDGPSPAADIETAGVDEVIANADHLVLAAPLTAATHHVIRAETLQHVRPGVHLVNVARGSD
jgi:phosphoglycerate dehydrogenase-like enzyme